MNKYESSLKQMCLQCKTKPQNCNKKKCTRYNNIKELVEKYNKQIRVVDKLMSLKTLPKNVKMVLENLGLIESEMVENVED